MIVKDSLRPLTEDELRELYQEFIDLMSSNLSPSMIETSEDRGYTAERVVSDLIGNILKLAQEKGIDAAEATYAALAFHTTYRYPDPNGKIEQAGLLLNGISRFPFMRVAKPVTE